MKDKKEPLEGCPAWAEGIPLESENLGQFEVDGSFLNLVSTEQINLIFRDILILKVVYDKKRNVFTYLGCSPHFDTLRLAGSKPPRYIARFEAEYNEDGTIKTATTIWERVRPHIERAGGDPSAN